MKAFARRVLLAIGLGCIAVSATAAQKLEVIVFPGGFNWPLWVAEARGLFASEGLDVRVTPTPNSVFQMQGLAEGRFDIAFTTVDNVVAYLEGQGEVAIEPTPDFFAFMGAQGGAVRLVARPEIASIGELRGRKLAVDTPTTGYAFVLRKLLEQGGVREGDYELQRLGATATRAEALMDGRTDATILTSPLEIVPESRGYRRLANAVDVLGPYQAVSAAARRSWAAANEKTLVAFIRAYTNALAWLRDPANRAEAIAIYRKQIPQASDIAAGKAWDALLGGREGFQERARLDRAGIETVLRLRGEYGLPKKALGPVDRYVDERYYRQVFP